MISCFNHKGITIYKQNTMRKYSKHNYCMDCVKLLNIQN